GEEALARLLPDDRPALEIPPPEVMDREAFEAMLPAGAVHQGVALLADPLPALDLEDLLRALPSDDAAQARPVRVAVLDQVTDPRNVGAVLRSAAAFGLAAVVVQDRHAPEATAALAKAASGALERVPLIRATNLARALDRLKQDGFWCVGLDGRARDSLPRLAPVGRTALVLGSEGAGLRRLVRERCDLLARIPIGDGVESLNVAAAAAVAFYELAREDRD
ncbi:MAG: RNA methyltransferase, partial [Rhodobacterales bacterium]|nr:RNA methyltransferase [Rhodobacterales bacterium]